MNPMEGVCKKNTPYRGHDGIKKVIPKGTEKVCTAFKLRHVSRPGHANLNEPHFPPTGKGPEADLTGMEAASANIDRCQYDGG